jgi:hypothetical protein
LLTLQETDTHQLGLLFRGWDLNPWDPSSELADAITRWAASLSKSVRSSLS